MTDLREMADYLRAGARDVLERQVVTWEDDHGMVQMFREDYADTLTIADYIQTGDVVKAKNHFYSMDTAARDEVYAIVKRKDSDWATDFF
jgi:hypothetical protein